jgi:molybdopterin molybdotransferase
MLGLDEARALLSSRVTPLAAEEVTAGQAAGLRLAAAVHAAADLPPADLSAMDGYAVRADDLAGGAPLQVALVLPAGAPSTPLPPGTAARIFTGAVVPIGADTVVPQELAEVAPDGRVRLHATESGSNVRPRGEVFALGAPLARAGETLTPARLATLVAGGVARVSVVPRPTVAVLATGGELGESGTAVAPGQVLDSNGPLLAALARESDLSVALTARVGDELTALCASIERAAAAAHLVITSGGVSVGEFDLVPRAVTKVGGEIVLHNVAIQPGKPILVARLGETWLVGLPGNPVSVFVGWRMFARPLAEALAGDPTAFAEHPLQAALAAPAHNRGDRTQLRPASLAAAAGSWQVTVLPWKGSHDILAAAPANALARLEPGAVLAAGAPVPCFPLPWRLSL